MQDLDYYKAKVMAVTGVSPEDFESKSRKRELVEARQAFFFDCKHSDNVQLKKNCFVCRRSRPCNGNTRMRHNARFDENKPASVCMG